MKKYTNFKKNKFGLVGLGGFISERHLKVIKELSQELVICHDIIDSVGLIDRYFPNAKFELNYNNYLKELKLKKVKFNVICSPNYLHHKHIIDTLKLGINAIVEKPPVLKQKQIKEISLLEKKFKVKCYVIFQLRFNKKLIKLNKQIKKKSKNILNKNKKFKVSLNYITSRGDWYKKSWKTNYRKSGGIIFNIGIHFFDLIFWIFGKPKISKLKIKTDTYCKGYIGTHIADINWVLSTDKKYLPKNIRQNNQNFFREIKINNKVFEFSKTFENLHLENYISILKEEKPDISSCNELIKFAEDINQNK
jgi:UDP-N-acetyl-2-amino-2-deoxyglucuronate dehydrogenase